MEFEKILDRIISIVWGPITMTLLFGTGVILTIGLKFINWRAIGKAIKLVKQNKVEDSSDGISPRAALFTALAATVGTGNIAGVATAITLGGPGAVFYMWLIALFGMATKFAETYAAVKYRKKNHKGLYVGGPMYYISAGFKGAKIGKIIATAFAVFGAVAAFGIGNSTQSNSIASGLQAAFNVPPIISGVVVAIVVAGVLIGGIKSIARVAEKVVPAMAVIYVLGSIVALIIFARNIPLAFQQIFAGAFAFKSAVAGGIGATIRYGFSRGIFSNEAGLGSAPIAHAAVVNRDPFNQALVAMLGVFIDTIIVCSFTALVVLASGQIDSGAKGAALTTQSFAAAFSGGQYLVSISLVLFAFTTILGWAYYGERCCEYLGGEKIILPYRLIFVVVVALSAPLKLELVWSVSDLFNGLMALPNLIGLLALAPIIFSEVRKRQKENHLVA